VYRAKLCPCTLTCAPIAIHRNVVPLYHGQTCGELLLPRMLYRIFAVALKLCCKPSDSWDKSNPMHRVSRVSTPRGEAVCSQYTARLRASDPTRIRASSRIRASDAIRGSEPARTWLRGSDLIESEPRRADRCPSGVRASDPRLGPRYLAVFLHNLVWLVKCMYRI
jgi:hypothetical protein